MKLEWVSLPTNKAQEAFTKANHGGLLLYSRRGDRRPSRFFNLPGLPGGIVDARTPRPHFPAELVELHQRFETSLFPERRLLISGRFQRAFADTLPLIPLAFGTQVSGSTRSLRGFDPGLSGSLWWNVETWAFSDQAAAPAERSAVAPATP